MRSNVLGLGHLVCAMVFAFQSISSFSAPPNKLLGNSFVSEEQKLEYHFPQKKIKSFAYRALDSQWVDIRAIREVIFDGLRSSKSIFDFDFNQKQGDLLFEKINHSPVWVFARSCPLCADKDKSYYGLFKAMDHGELFGGFLFKHCLFVGGGCGPTELSEQVALATLEYLRLALSSSKKLPDIYKLWLKAHGQFADLLKRKGRSYLSQDKYFLLKNNIIKDSNPVMDQCISNYLLILKGASKNPYCKNALDAKTFEYFFEGQLLKSQVPGYFCQAKCSKIMKLKPNQNWPEIVRFGTQWSALVADGSCDGTRPIEVPSFLGKILYYFVKNDWVSDRSKDALIGECIADLLSQWEEVAPSIPQIKTQERSERASQIEVDLE